jgi:2-oxoglutarate dehydrogenase E2 component (dihydrolipoamide succinyltransferase)
MSIEIRVPTLGESIVEATVASWLKQEGDAVRRGEALLELETDKVNVEVNAEQDGVLQQIIKPAGAEVAVGEVLGVLSEGASPASTPPVTAQANGQKSTKVESLPTASVVAPSAQQQSGPLQHTDAQRPPSPLAKRIASEHNVDISQVRGSSPHGRVTKEDVINYMEQTRTPSQTLPAVTPTPAPAAAAAPSSSSNGRPEERVRMSRRRQTIAQRLVEAQHTAAMLTTFNEIDMTAIMDIRARRKDAFKERHEVSLGFMSFFTKAVVGGLKSFPRLNAEIQGTDMVLKRYYDIGIAVGAEEGLVVPVVRDADRKSFAQIEREIADYAKRARANTLALADLQGGTFTITNGGIFGSLLSTPILNGPQVAILGMHKIEQRPIALKGQVVIRPMMYVALSYDHRIVDGREAVQFLVRVKELLEDPESLLIEG